MVTSTIGPSKDHATISAWEGLHQADLTSADAEEAVCYAFDDTTAVLIYGWTTTADHYVGVRVDSTARHAGVWNGDKYNLVIASADAFTIGEDYVRVDGLQISVPTPDAAGDDILVIGSGLISATNNDIWLSNLILVGGSHATNGQSALICSDADTNLKVWNVIAYGIGTAPATSLVFNLNCTVALVYSCTLIGGKYAYYNTAGTNVLKNVYCGGSGTEDFYLGGGTMAKTNCASEDQSADDTKTGETQTNCVAAAVLVDTDTFVNVTAGSQDFHLAADGNSPLEDAGVDTSGDSAPMNFTTDIDGDTITTYPIGADFRYVAPVTGYINELCVIFEC